MAETSIEGTAFLQARGGKVLLLQGDAGDFLCLIASGIARASRRERHNRARLGSMRGPAEHFGETSPVASGIPRVDSDCNAYPDTRSAGGSELIMEATTSRAENAKALGPVVDIVEDPRSVALSHAGRRAAIDPLLARDVDRAMAIGEHTGFDETLDFERWAQAASTPNPLLGDAIGGFSR